MKSIKIAAVFLYCVIVMPIWYYLVYKILQRVDASELMWFLFWIYIPVSFIAIFVIRLSDEKEKE